MDIYSYYNIGDIFHNDNGEDYFIIALNEKEDKALLGKVADDGTPFYIGTTGLGMNYWRYGHYFMENLANAIKWYMNEDSKLEESDNRPTIKTILERIVGYQELDIYLYDRCTYLTFRFKGNQIPNGFLRCHVDLIGLDGEITFSFDSSSEKDLDMNEMIDVYYNAILNY